MLRRRSSQAPTRLTLTRESSNPQIHSSRSRIPVCGRVSSASSERRQSPDRKPQLPKRSKSNLGLTQATPIRKSVAVNKQNLGSVQKQLNLAGVPSNRKSTFKADTRPYQDKKWQQSQLAKIQTYLNSVGVGNLCSSLRPLTTKAFVEVCNLCFKSIDPMLQITLANYAEELPMILHLLNHPFNLKKSMLSTVNIPRNWPMALGVMGWLVQLVNVSDDLEKGLDELLADTKFQTEFSSTKYRDWLDKGCEIEDCQPEYLEHIMSQTDFPHQINLLKKQIQKSEAELRSILSKREQLENNLKVLENAETELTDLRESYQKLKTENVNLDAEIQSKKDCYSSIKAKLDTKQSELIAAKAMADQQKMSKEEWVGIMKECRTLEDENNSHTDLINHIEKCKIEEDKKIMELNKRVIALKTEYNKICLTEPELEKFAVVNLHLLNEDSLQTLSNINNELKIMLKTKTSELEKLESEEMHLLNDLKTAESLKANLIETEKKVLPGLHEELEQSKVALSHSKEKLKEHMFELQECRGLLQTKADEINTLNQIEETVNKKVEDQIRHLEEVAVNFALGIEKETVETVKFLHIGVKK